MRRKGGKVSLEGRQAFLGGAYHITASPALFSIVCLSSSGKYLLKSSVKMSTFIKYNELVGNLVCRDKDMSLEFRPLTRAFQTAFIVSGAGGRRAAAPRLPLMISGVNDSYKASRLGNVTGSQGKGLKALLRANWGRRCALVSLK